MKLEKNNIKIETNEFGEISSINFFDQEVLHNGKEWWKKTYPMIWPVTSFSTAFEVNNRNYKLPKHGFWKELNWETIKENDSITLLATFLQNDVYPFSIDIQHNIAIENNEVIISTTFSNLGKEDAYFNFGHHPAFIIDQNSILDVPYNGQKITSEGKLSKEIAINQKFIDMDFGIEYDTISYKDVKFDEVSFKANGIDITVEYSDFDDLQIWKPQEAMFICIEPWQGWNDKEYDSPSIASEKIGIIHLPKDDVITKKIKIKLEKNKI